MRSTDTTQRPTIEFDGELRICDGHFASCAVQIWFAPNAYDPMKIRVVASPLPGELKLPTEIRSRAGLYCSADAEIVLEGVWLRHWITSSKPARRHLHHIVELASVHCIVASSRLEKSTVEAGSRKKSGTRFSIRLSDSVYLSPFYFARPDVKRVLKFEQRDHIKARHPVLGVVKFERQYRFLQDENKDVQVSSELVAMIGKLTKDSAGKVDAKATVREFEDFCLLASVASRHRIRIRGWKFEATGVFEEAFVEPLDSGAGLPKIDAQDVLINRAHVPSFLEHCANAWRKFSADEQRKLRHACFALAPAQNLTIEGSFLAMFPALEGLVSIFRSREGRDFVYGPNQSWKAIQKQLEKAIDMISLDDPLFNPKAIKRNLPALKRVPLAESTRKVLTDLRAWSDVLWPVFDNTAPSLASIRNHLAHGEYLDTAKLAAVVVARTHLQILLERTFCCALGWPLDDTDVSDGVLHGQDRRFAKEISGACAILRGIEPDADAAAFLPVQIG